MLGTTLIQMSLREGTPFSQGPATDQALGYALQIHFFTSFSQEKQEVALAVM